nr:polysaccharide pyruvyl transferase family protein [Qipengyuania proteolytica]
MHFASEGAVVWGSGVNGKARSDIYEFENLDVRACRGPRTKAWLEQRGINVPAVFGDPALLLPILTHGRFSATKNSQKIVFVPNLFDDMEQLDIPANVTVVKPTQSWNNVVAEILEARFVVSSSLHGIIVAEAFGIPAQFIAVSKEENEFKYNDYYEGTGRNRFTVARTIEEAIDLGGEDLPDFDPQPLMEAFPYDLWKS